MKRLKVRSGGIVYNCMLRDYSSYEKVTGNPLCLD